MSEADYSLYDYMLEWVKTFQCGATVSRSCDLTDGVVMSQMLHEIAPDFFHENWLTRIKTDTGQNWRLKQNNVKKILKGVMDFYAEELGKHLNGFETPNVTRISEEENEEELGRLLQLILGCAVNCHAKEEYIQRVMQLDEFVQVGVMEAIQQLISYESHSSPLNSSQDAELIDQLKKISDELNDSNAMKDDLAQRCHELDLQVASLQEEKASLTAEVQEFRSKQSVEHSQPNQKQQVFQFQIDSLKEETYRLEAERDALRAKVDLQEKEEIRLRTQIHELSKIADEAKNLQDEIDELHATSDKVQKYENIIETYKKKLEEIPELRRQRELQDDKVNELHAQVSALEEELRRSGSSKKHADMYKKQVHDLQTQNSAEIHRADKAEFELKRITERLSALEEEKMRLAEERDRLKEALEELKCSQMSQETNSTDFSEESDVSNLELSSLSPALRERILQLQKENKFLKLTSTESNVDTVEEVRLLKEMLEDAQSRVNELNTENRISNQRIIELEAQVGDFTNEENAVSSSDGSLKQQLLAAQSKVKELGTELEEKRTFIEQLEKRMGDSESKVAKADDELEKMRSEMRVMEEKYKKYLEKAKSVIKNIRGDGTSIAASQGSATEVEILREAVKSRDKIIESLREERQEELKARKREEKCLVSAWYNLGMQLHRKAVEGRVSGGLELSDGLENAVPSSFLSRQRMIENRRVARQQSNSNSVQTLNQKNLTSS